jgi:molecular chaperone DnaK (HSP70)
MWAIDIGTTNTRLARWDEKSDRPHLIPLPAIMPRGADGEESTGALNIVPSSTQLVEAPGVWARLVASGPLAGRLLWGRLAHIGQQAIERSDPARPRGFVRTFKSALGREPLRPLTHLGGRSHSARDVAWHFLRELLAEVQRQTGERIRELTVTVPVASYEAYRAELSGVLSRLGVARVHFIDEPVAAAIGYSLASGAGRSVLVVDFGGGTLDLALLKLDPDALRSGTCRVLAKAGRALGGNRVDGWLLEHFCRRLGYELSEPEDEDARFWQQLMLREARRVKEALEKSPTASFGLYPPDELRRFEARLSGECRELSVSRQEVVELLEERGLYRALDDCLREVLGGPGAGELPVDDVLLVGGSTLLPEVFARFARHFGRDRVRYWQPFEAVAYGAAIFAARRVHTSDFILHDYALLTHHATSGEASHSVIIPRGTRFPTAMNFWERQLVPSCALGEPERFFKLVICEIGEGGDDRSFGWDDAGNLHRLGGSADAPRRPLVVKLNEANPALGDLSPPHSPSDRRPRLRVAFGVNADRWLCATVEDLLAKRRLMDEEPVVRLL